MNASQLFLFFICIVLQLNISFATKSIDKLDLNVSAGPEAIMRKNRFLRYGIDTTLIFTYQVKKGTLTRKNILEDFLEIDKLFLSVPGAISVYSMYDISLYKNVGDVVRNLSLDIVPTKKNLIKINQTFKAFVKNKTISPFLLSPDLKLARFMVDYNFTKASLFNKVRFLNDATSGNYINNKTVKKQIALLRLDNIIVLGLSAPLKSRIFPKKYNTSLDFYRIVEIDFRAKNKNSIFSPNNIKKLDVLDVWLKRQKDVLYVHSIISQLKKLHKSYNNNKISDSSTTKNKIAETLLMHEILSLKSGLPSQFYTIDKSSTRIMIILRSKKHQESLKFQKKLIKFLVALKNN